ncbi:MAG: zinc ribbon domain-containing protein [Syntrophorhabdaceae bacterium]|nr:zinc ribbon domain-containing protein [Syntrophorhabdaceae bacterium]
MPIYEYQCESCGKYFEIFQKITDPPLTECKFCKGKLNKLISNCAFHLKGTGWYVTDYKRPIDAVGKQAKPSNGNGTQEKSASEKFTSSESKSSSDTKTTET